MAGAHKHLYEDELTAVKAESLLLWLDFKVYTDLDNRER